MQLDLDLLFVYKETNFVPKEAQTLLEKSNKIFYNFALGA